MTDFKKAILKRTGLSMIIGVDCGLTGAVSFIDEMEGTYFSVVDIPISQSASSSRKVKTKSIRPDCVKYSQQFQFHLSPLSNGRLLCQVKAFRPCFRWEIRSVWFVEFYRLFVSRLFTFLQWSGKSISKLAPTKREPGH